MLNNFYALVFRQKYIKRWGLMHNLREETTAQHSSEVAILTHALASIGNLIFGKDYDIDRATTLALFHDVPEVYTGDLPTPVKYYNDDIRLHYGIIEDIAADRLLSKLPEELRDSYRKIMCFDKNSPEGRLVKTADRLCALIKCIEEEKGGNSEFLNAKKSILESFKSYSGEELDYFMENILPGFELTLDEL